MSLKEAIASDGKRRAWRTWLNGRVTIASGINDIDRAISKDDGCIAQAFDACPGEVFAFNVSVTVIVNSVVCDSGRPALPLHRQQS